MTYEAYMIIFYSGTALSIIFLVTSVILFFVLRIVRVIGDLSGATARKAINNIREQNELSGDKAYKSSPVNRSRGMVTDKITHSGRLIPKVADTTGISVGTEKITFSGGETTLLESTDMNSETTLLVISDEDETTVLGGYSHGKSDAKIFEVNNAAIAEDELESASVESNNIPVYSAIPAGFSVETDITVINTNERID